MRFMSLKNIHVQEMDAEATINGTAIDGKGASLSSRAFRPSAAHRACAVSLDRCPCCGLSQPRTGRPAVLRPVRCACASSVEPGGCTPFRSHSNSNVLIHPARGQVREAPHRA